VILDSFEGILAVTSTHDSVTLLGGGGDFKVLREFVGLSAEGMIANRMDFLWNILETSQAHANTESWDPAHKVCYGCLGTPGPGEIKTT
jgi:hypothetical protein